jgi:hypothetical protein
VSLQREPHFIDASAWWYEERQGMLFVVDGRILPPIPWDEVWDALDRANADALPKRPRAHYPLTPDSECTDSP